MVHKTSSRSEMRCRVGSVSRADGLSRPSLLMPILAPACLLHANSDAPQHRLTPLEPTSTFGRWFGRLVGSPSVLWPGNVEE